MFIIKFKPFWVAARLKRGQVNEQKPFFFFFESLLEMF